MALLVKEAPVIWNLLNGVVPIYKSAGETVNSVRRNILNKLCAELNSLEGRPPAPFATIDEETKLLTVRPSFSDHPLVVGPRYTPEDFKCFWATFLGFNTSGVFGLNNGTKEVINLHNKYPIRTYLVKGQLGYLTDNLFSTGKIIEKCKYHRAQRGSLEKILMALQASHQRLMFEGVNLQSQEAYDLAAKGLVRPKNSKLPIIYGAKCIDFNPPDFTIELHCINEYEAYLMAIIQNIGTRLQTAATCTGIKCTQHSYFTLENALLKRHWSLEHILKSLSLSKRLIESQSKLTDKIDHYKKSIDNNKHF